MMSQINIYEEEKLERVKRGQICYYNFPESGKCVQKGIRPCLVVGNNKQNAFSEIVVVVPITSSKNKRPLPTHVEIPEGYSVYGTVVCEQIITASLEKLRPTTDYFDEEMMEKVDEALGIELDISHFMIKRDDAEYIKLQQKLELLRQKLLQYQELLDSVITLNAIEQTEKIRPTEVFLDKIEEHIHELRR